MPLQLRQCAQIYQKGAVTKNVRAPLYELYYHVFKNCGKMNICVLIWKNVIFVPGTAVLTGFMAKRVFAARPTKYGQRELPRTSGKNHVYPGKMGLVRSSFPDVCSSAPFARILRSAPAVLARISPKKDLARYFLSFRRGRS